MRGLTVTAISLVVLSSAGFGRAAQTPKKTPNISQLPISFEPNQGQADRSALYVARGAGYYVTLDGSGARILLRAGDHKADIHTRLAGANPSAALSASSRLPGYSAYFRGKDSSKWLTNVPNFGKVTAASVYPGIDVVYYGNQSRLEYDFVVAPHADPRKIRMRFDGVANLRTDAAGNLILGTAAGDIVEHTPEVYQEIAGVRRPVDGSFAVARNGEVTFHLGAYDRSLPLVIDPFIVYSSFLGGYDIDEGHAVAADAAGNMYMTGVTYSTQANDADVLLRKITPDGTAFVWNADLGGSSDDFGNGLAVDANGFVYVGGDTFSTDFPTAPKGGAWQPNLAGDRNAFVLRIDPSATTLLFSTYFGGSVDDFCYSIAIDPQGSVYLTGSTDSPDLPTSSGAYQTVLKGNSDVFVVKFDINGNAQYSTFVGGGSDNEAWGITVDGNGNAYITGDTNSDSYPQVNPPFQHSRHGGLDAFLTVVSSDGTQLLFSTFIGGGGDDSGSGIALDSTGSIYIVGTTASTDFPTTSGAYNTSYNGGTTDIFVVKFAPQAQSLTFATYLGSHGTDDGSAIAVDSHGTIYIAGDTNSDQYPVTGSAAQPNRGGGFDAVVSVLDTNGRSLLYSTFYGGSGDDSAMAIAVDPFFNVYVTGATASGNLFVTPGAVQPQPGGGQSDAFLLKLNLQSSSIPGSDAPATTTLATPAIPSATTSVFGRGIVQSGARGEFRSHHLDVAQRSEMVTPVTHTPSHRPFPRAVNSERETK